MELAWGHQLMGELQPHLVHPMVLIGRRLDWRQEKQLEPCQQMLRSPDSPGTGNKVASGFSPSASDWVSLRSSALRGSAEKEANGDGLKLLDARRCTDSADSDGIERSTSCRLDLPRLCCPRSAAPMVDRDSVSSAETEDVSERFL